MDPVKMEKIKAMERYKKIQFLQNLFQYLLTALVLAMAISKAFPSSLVSAMQLFFSVSLPRIGTFLVSPKCIFVVGNAIVIFLFSESKLAGTSTSSQEIYDEYLRHQRSLQRQSSVEAKEEEKRLEVRLGEGEAEVIKGDLEVIKRVEEEKNEEEEKEEQVQQEEEEKEKEDEQLGEYEERSEAPAEEKTATTAAEEIVADDEEEADMEADELNKRAEDFIARVTKQFRLEAQMLVCAG